jgi:hypothetical protein
MEGFQTEFRSYNRFSPSGTYRNAPSATLAPSFDESDRQTMRLAPGASFDAYKRPTMIRTPRGDYDTSAGAPTTMSASEFLRKKYGDFSGATEIVPPPAAAPPQTQIMGKEALTEGDLRLLQNAVDIELIRLQNLRSASALVTIKIGQLQVVSENLADVVGRVGRKEIPVESVAIFPATARQFLKTFRMSENVPELFDPNGNSPASMSAASAAAAPTSLAPALAPALAPTTTSSAAPAAKPDFLHWLFENIQKLKWSMDADYRAEAAKQRQVSKSLKDMEQRILDYSYSDTPMPEGYEHMFLERIRGLQKEIIVPE